MKPGQSRQDRSVRALWRRLPWDGEGWAASSDPDLVQARLWSGARFRRRVAPPLRPLLHVADRLGWAAAALARTRAFARRRGLAGDAAGRLFLDCLLSGANPAEADLWRGLHGGRHPLPARGAGLLLSRLGDPEGHALLADKLAAAERLGGIGLAVPRLLRAIDGAGAEAAPSADWPDDLFVKPRRGSAGRGSFALTKSGEGWRLGEAPPQPWAVLCRDLRGRAAGEPLLVQERLAAHPDLADLADAGRPPVLRLTTTRLPGGAPCLHAALVEVPVPGRATRDFLEGVLRVPVDLSGGRLMPGLLFARPRERFARLPWSGAPLSGRAMPGFAEAAAAVLAAMAAVPALPLVGWDSVPTPRGPVLLEGNTQGNWIVTTLAACLGCAAGPPPGRVVAAWCEVGGTGPDDR